MTEYSWGRLEPLLEGCLGLSESERRAYLGKTCEEDTAFEVLRLLEEEARDQDFLAAPLPVGPSVDEEGDYTGRRIGAYRLLRSLGEGGMSVVWLARHAESISERAVAVKLLRRRLQSGEWRQRFLTERGALACLVHPFIARLLDSGSTEGGQPYLVMEYVDGGPIDSWCDERRLTLAQRLEIFGKVCDAVAHAHAGGVIHGDLKPRNILVLAEGTPKLLDFGLAQTLMDGGRDPDPEPPTRIVHRAFSPQYASPEQVRGEPIGVASDVYSLGVVLYELLTGGSPLSLHGLSQQQLERVVSLEEPRWPSSLEGAPSPPLTAAKPSTHASVEPETAWSLRRRLDADALRRAMRGDLDRIMMTALRKEPALRHATVPEFADQVSRAKSAIQHEIPGSRTNGKPTG